jgi:ubiquinone/menaquinone biosynthesis C-methylase UbiE
MEPGDTLLDIGCGIGAFNRTLAVSMPGLKITGFDSNLFAIETAKKENKQQGLSDRIKMVVGDAREDLEGYADRSFDWVTAINIFHFFPVDRREELISKMIRLARKGVFFTEIIVEKTKISFAADPLMSLLWNDFTGFFREADAERINSGLKSSFPKYRIERHPILQNSSWLVSIIKDGGTRS